jgi:PAS domain S-box-containing protein/diguanylate cyclase (GGDEF)-like protein
VRVEEGLRESEERFRATFEQAAVGIAHVAPDGRWLRVNRQLCEMTGYGEEQLLKASFQDITHPDDLELDLEQVQAVLAGRIRVYEMEKRYFRADGSILWVQLSVSLVRDENGEPLYFVSQLQDVDERKRAHTELQRLARRDPLTGTLNRRAWDEELGGAVSRSARTGEPLGVVLIDINRFKHVNDSLGHQAGDILLQQAVSAWQRHLRGADVLARIGGDEFAVLVPSCSGDELSSVAERLRQALAYLPGCAVGATAWKQGDTAAELMGRADKALYADKAAPTTVGGHLRSA